MSNLQQRYIEEIRPQLQQELGLENIMAVPRLEKVTLNMGVGDAVADRKVMESAMADMKAIAGQQPIVCLARKSEAGFKIREGWPIGCKVTLRSGRMYDFIERLIGIAIPRNFSMGVTEQIMFPEIDYDKIDKIRGLDICVTTSAGNNDDALALLKAFSFPFRA